MEFNKDQKPDYYFAKFGVKSFDVDLNNHLKLGSWFKYLQEAAHLQATQLGFGYQHLKEKGYFWVLSRLSIKIESYPSMDEEITIKTWPKGFQNIFATRDFEVMNAQNEVIAKATSAWLVIDAKTLRPQKPGVVRYDYQLGPEWSAIPDFPEKIEPCCSETRLEPRKARFSDLDLNHHVNNARYIDWICDALDAGFFNQNQITKFQINYLAETRANEELDIIKTLNSEGEIFIEAVNRNSGKKVFQAVMK